MVDKMVDLISSVKFLPFMPSLTPNRGQLADIRSISSLVSVYQFQVSGVNLLCLQIETSPVDSTEGQGFSFNNRVAR